MTKPKISKHILSRDVSWMYFNHRVLQESQREGVPLLERLNFLGIYSNNLDEFFRVRVSSIKRVIEYESPDHDRTIRLQAIRDFKAVNKLTKKYLDEFEASFALIKGLLQDQGIKLIDQTELSEQQARLIRSSYGDRLSSSIYPLMVSQGAHFGGLNDSSIYFIVKLMTKAAEKENQDDHPDFALIELPSEEFGRFVVLPGERGEGYVMFLDDVVRFCLPMIFSGQHYTHYEAYTFQFTRDAEIELFAGIGEGLIEKIAQGVKNRKKGEPVRLEYDRDMPRDVLEYIQKRLKIDQYDAIDAGLRYHNMRDLMSFPRLGRSELQYPPRPAIAVPLFHENESAMGQIRQRDYLMHCPYHNFSNYIRLLREAAISPAVKSIKTTVYRLAKNSKVVQALICAAKNGKKVTVVVELMARFDESSNIDWSKKMQAEGIEVIFGVEGLKVHSKLTLISSSKGDVACVSTGNFHEGNAKVYTDVILMTASEAITREVKEVFQYIRQPYRALPAGKMLVSPQRLRKQLYKLIDDEIKQVKAGKKGYLLCKINHITDRKLIRRLYQASEAGVQMRFLVRGNCSLITGVPGLSENIEVRGIIDRYLEHSRILIFGGGGQERYYIGSADWMTRNIDNRVETMVPVYDPLIQAQLKQIIEYGLADNTAARIVDGSGENLIFQNGVAEFRSQEELYHYYQQQVCDTAP